MEKVSQKALILNEKTLVGFTWTNFQLNCRPTLFSENLTFPQKISTLK